MKIRPLLLAITTAVFIVLGTSFTFFYDVPYNEKRLVEGLLLVLSVGVVCSSRALQRQWLSLVKRLKIRNIPFITVISLIFGFGILSSVFAENPLSAFLLVSHYFLLFNAVIVAVIGYQQYPKYFEIGFLLVIGLAAGLYLINVAISYGYVYFVPDFPLWPETDFTRIYFENIGFMYPEPFSNFVNFRFFNHLQTWSLPLLALLAIRIPKKYWAFSKIAFIILCGWWMLVFASDARGTTISSFIAIAFIFYMYRDKAQIWLKEISYSAIIGFIGYGLLFKLFPLLVGTESSRTAFSRYSPGSERFALWENASKIIVENPVFGVGPMHFSAWSDVHSKAPHNIYMQFVGEWGLIAGILCAVIIIAGGYKWFKKSSSVISNSSKNSNSVNVRVALTASLLAALTHGLVSGIINTPISQIMMVLVVGWMIGLSISKEQNKEETNLNSFWQRAGLIGVNVLVAVFLIWSYSVQVPNLDENRQQYLELIKNEENANRLSPRYWDQGVIGLPEIKKEE
jgi:uncharacterized membrane protein